MAWQDMTVGGVIVIVFFGLSSWLGKVWANRILGELKVSGTFSKSSESFNKRNWTSIEETTGTS